MKWKWILILAVSAVLAGHSQAAAPEFVDSPVCGCKNRSDTTVALVGFVNADTNEQVRVFRNAFLEASKNLRLDAHEFLPSEDELTNVFGYQYNLALEAMLTNARALPNLKALLIIVHDEVAVGGTLASIPDSIQVVTVGAGARRLLNTTTRQEALFRPIVHLGVDEFAVGYGLGTRAALAKGSGAICNVGQPSISSQVERCAGFVEGFSSNCPGCNVTVTYAPALNSQLLFMEISQHLATDPSVNMIAVSSGAEVRSLSTMIKASQLELPKFVVFSLDKLVEEKMNEQEILVAADSADYLAAYLGTTFASIAATTGQKIANGVIETGPEFLYQAPQYPNLRREHVRLESIQHGRGADGWWLDWKKGSIEATRDLGLKFEDCPQGGLCDSPVSDGTLTYRAPDSKFDLTIMSSMISQAGLNRPHGIFLTIPNVAVLEDSIRSTVEDLNIPMISSNAGGEVSKDLGMLAHLGQDETLAGEAAGEALGKAGVTKAVCLNHNYGHTALESRCNGALRGLARALDIGSPDPSLFEVVVVQYSNIAELQSNLIDKLLGDSSINGVLVLNPNMCTLTKTELALAGLNSTVQLGCFDVIPDTVSQLLAGEVLFAVQQQQQLQSYLPTLLLTIRALTGQFMKTDVIHTGPALIYKEGASAVTCQHDLACPPSEEGWPGGSSCPRPSWVGDGWCDPINNIEACHFDGGDCCQETCSDTSQFTCNSDEFQVGFNSFDCLDKSTRSGLERHCMNAPTDPLCATLGRLETNLRVGIILRQTDDSIDSQSSCFSQGGEWHESDNICSFNQTTSLAKLAVQHFNERQSSSTAHLADTFLGGCNKQIEVFLENDKGTELGAAEAAIRLLRDSEVDILVAGSKGAVSTALLAALYGRPVLSYGAQSVHLDDRVMFPTFRRVAIADTKIAAGVCHFWAESHYSYAAVLAPGSSAGRALTLVISKECMARNITVSVFTYDESVTEGGAIGESDVFDGEIKRLSDSTINVVLCVGDGNSLNQVLIQAHAQGALAAGKTWTFIETSDGTTGSGWTSESLDANVRKALSGSFSFRSSATGLSSLPAFRKFAGNWPFDKEISTLDAYLYDTIQLAGRASCASAPQSRIDNMEQFSEDVFEAISTERVSFEGLTGKVAFSPLGNREPSEVSDLELVNLVQDQPLAFSSRVLAFYNGSFDYNCVSCVEQAVVYNGDLTEKPVNVVIPSQNYEFAKSGLINLCRFLGILVILLGLCFFGMAMVHRKHPIIKAAQVPFVAVLCFGAMLSGVAILFLTVDDRSQPAGPQGGNHLASAACFASVTFYATGFVLATGAILLKLFRVSKVFDVEVSVSHGNSLNRSISTMYLFRYLAKLVFLEAIILVTWAAVDPLLYKRYPLLVDDFGNVLVSRGACSSEYSGIFVALLIVHHFALLTYAAVLSYRTSAVSTAFAEGRYLNIAIFSTFQISLLALTLVMLVADQASLRMFVLSGAIALDNTAILLVLFVPKFYMMHFGVDDSGVGGSIINEVIQRSNGHRTTGQRKSVIASSIAARPGTILPATSIVEVSKSTHST